MRSRKADQHAHLISLNDPQIHASDKNNGDLRPILYHGPIMEPPRRLYQLRVHQFSKCFVSWPNQKLEFPPVPVSFQKFITSSGIVLISFYYQE